MDTQNVVHPATSLMAQRSRFWASTVESPGSIPGSILAGELRSHKAHSETIKKIFFNRVHPYSGTLFSLKKKGNFDTCHDVDALWEHHAKWNAAAAAAKSLQSCPTLCDPIDGSPPGSPIRTNVWFHVYEVPRAVRFTETKRRVDARAWKEGGMGISI